MRPAGTLPSNRGGIGRLRNRLLAVFALVVVAAVARPETRAEDEHRGESELLSRLLDDPRHAITATGSEILALGTSQRKSVERWVLTGGRLELSGEARDLALQLLVPGADRSLGPVHLIGLGEIEVLAEGGAVPPLGTEGTKSCDLGGTIEPLARSSVPEPGPFRTAMALRLVAYGLLLSVGGLLAGSLSNRSRIAVGASLVSVFALWPWWTSWTPSGAGHWSQVDVLVDTGSGPSVLWSAAAFRASTRGRASSLHSGSGTWDLRVVEPSDHGFTLVEQPAEAGVGDGPGGSFPSARGSLVGFSWIAEGGVDDEILVDVVRQEGRWTGLIRNGFPRAWTDVWLLVPGAPPRRLEILAPGGAVIVDEPDPHAKGGEDSAGPIWDRLPAHRSEVLEGAFRCAVLPLIRRQQPVLVAWSETPVRPARTGRKLITHGATLLISSGRARS